MQLKKEAILTSTDHTVYSHKQNLVLNIDASLRKDDFKVLKVFHDDTTMDKFSQRRTGVFTK